MKSEIQAMLDTYVTKRGVDENGDHYTEYYPSCIISENGEKRIITAKTPIKTIYDKDQDNSKWYTHGEYITIEYDPDNPDDFNIVTNDEDAKRITRLIIIATILIAAFWLLTLKFGVKMPMLPKPGLA